MFLSMRPGTATSDRVYCSMKIDTENSRSVDGNSRKEQPYAVALAATTVHTRKLGTRARALFIGRTRVLLIRPMTSDKENEF